MVVSQTEPVAIMAHVKVMASVKTTACAWQILRVLAIAIAVDYKLSYYTLFSDDLNQKSESVLFCTRSGESLVISRYIRRILESGDFGKLPEKILEKLLTCKAIVPAGEQELLEIIRENKNAIEETTVLYEVIQPTAMCQLGCDYCGQSHHKTQLSGSLQDALISRIRNKVSAKKYLSLLVGWFGAEPLLGLAQIRSLTPRLKSLADESGMTYRAKIVTNGLSLKSGIFEELVKELSIKQIEITLDGTDLYHDNRRHTKEGHKTFEIIFDNLMDITSLENFENMGCQISIRCNVDGRNYEGVTPLINLLAKNGLHKKIAYFYAIGVYSWGGNSAHQKSLSKEEFAKMEIDWMIDMLKVGFTPAILPVRQKQVCMAVSPVSEMYDAYGNIFNCTEVSYSPVYENTQYNLGNLKTDAKEVSADRPLGNWNDSLSTDKFPCHSCKMLPVCGGGCPKSWHEDMRACPSAKFNIKERLALSYVASKLNLAEVLNAEEPA
jgi:uncharacterized protein